MKYKVKRAIMTGLAVTTVITSSVPNNMIAYADDSDDKQSTKAVNNEEDDGINKVTYHLDDGSTWNDGTTDDIVYETPYTIEGVNNVARESKIKYSDVPVPVKDGYIFCGWTSTEGCGYGDVTTSTANYSDKLFICTSHTGTSFVENKRESPDSVCFTVYDDVKLYPVWTKAVKFDANGGAFDDGTLVKNATQDMIYSSYTKANGNQQYAVYQNLCPEPKREGYRFLGWSNQENPIEYAESKGPNEIESLKSSLRLDDFDYFARLYENIASASVQSELGEKTVYAVWVPETVKITYHLGTYNIDGDMKNLGDNGENQCHDYIDDTNPEDKLLIQYVPFGEDVESDELYRLAENNFVQKNWYKDTDFKEEYNSESNIVCDRELYTYCEAYVNYNANGGENPEDSDYYIEQYDGQYDHTDTVKLGDSLSEPEVEPVRENYTFGGWYTDSECSDDSKVDFSNTKVTGNTTLYAKWIYSAKWTVTFNDYLDGDIETQEVKDGELATKPDYNGNSEYAANPNYELKGWSIDGSENLFDFNTPITSDLTLYSVYDHKEEAVVEPYDVIFNANGGHFANGLVYRLEKTKSHPHLDEQAQYVDFPVIEPEREGYEFLGWSLAENEDGTIDIHRYDLRSISLTKNTEYKAVWKEIEKSYKVTFDFNGGTVKTGYGEVVREDENGNVTCYRVNTWTDENKKQYLTFPAEVVEREGYEFLGWSLAEDENNTVVIDANTSGRVYFTKDTNYKAVWKAKPTEKKFTVTFNSNGGTDVPSQEVEKGNKATKPTDPVREGYTFVGWTYGLLEFNFNTPVFQNMTLVAQWKQNEEPKPTEKKFTVTFKNYDGSVLKTEEVIEHGSATAPDNPTYSDATGCRYSFIGWDSDFSDVTSDMVVYAKYLITGGTIGGGCIVTFDSNGGSDVPSQEVDEGSWATRPTDPVRAGYEFIGWTYEQSEYEFNTPVEKDITLVAQWKKIPEEIKHKVVFKDWDGTVLKTETVKDKDSATAPETPKRTGYKFISWSEDFTIVTKDLEIIAEYTKNPEPVKPTEPAEPVKPEPKPEQPKPEQPKPEQPKPIKPTEPVKPTEEKPEVTPVKPTTPEVTPEKPEVTPEKPEVTPEQPEVTPEKPEVTPEVEPETPEVTPKKPDDVVNELTPEDEPEKIYVGDSDTDKDTKATLLGRFVEAVKVMAVVVSIGLGAILGILGLLLLLLAWRKRIKVLNDKNTDEYGEEDYEVDYRTSVKSEGNMIAELSRQQDRVWTVVIPDEIINQRVTDSYKVELKKHFCKKYNGEQLVIKLGDSDNAKQLGFVIDEAENTIKFKFTE